MTAIGVNVVGLSWDFNTISGHGAIGERMVGANAIVKARNFAIDGERLAPRILERAGTQVVEAILSFETTVGIGEGLVRIRLDDAGGDAPLAWSLMTALDRIRRHGEWTVQETSEEPAFLRDFHGPNRIEKRDAMAAYIDHDPAVLVVGGGHAGITVAARLGALGVDALVIDREKRIGDNWRLRYHGLKLHNQPPSNHMPYLPFPKTWKKYTPKEKIANWLESYVDILGINFWIETGLEGASYDATHGC